ncbi:MAG: protein CpxP [Ulvibacter sp.]|jgi:hypothetical protein
MKMKSLMIIMLTLISSASYAQQDKNEVGHHKKEMRQKDNNFSPEQKAELATKKMTLHLDLNEAQQKQLFVVRLEQAKLIKERFKNKKNRSQLTDEERFKIKTERLDHQIAMKKKMKSILTEEQFTTWQKASHTRKKAVQREHKRLDACSKKR